MYIRYTGCHNAEQEAFVKQKLHKISTIDTGGLPYEIIFVLDKYYMLTTNVDVSDGLANGAVGKLCSIDYDDNGEIIRVWLIFSNSEKIGRKSLNRIQTITNVLTNLISNRKGISIFSLNCQSLREHASDLNDAVTQHSFILILSETWVNNDENVNIPNFDCVVKFKRPDCRAAGVAIFKNNRDTSTIATSHMNIASQNSQSLGLNPNRRNLCSEM